MAEAVKPESPGLFWWAQVCTSFRGGRMGWGALRVLPAPQVAHVTTDHHDAMPSARCSRVRSYVVVVTAFLTLDASATTEPACLRQAGALGTCRRIYHVQAGKSRRADGAGPDLTSSSLLGTHSTGPSGAHLEHREFRWLWTVGALPTEGQQGCGFQEEQSLCWQCWWAGESL